MTASRASHVATAEALPSGRTSHRYDALPPGLAPRGLCREAAARYIGISPSMFDLMVDAGRMPGPKQIGTRKVWDIRKLDIAFDALPDGSEANVWDTV